MSFVGDRNESFIVVSMEHEHHVDMDEDLSTRVDDLSTSCRRRETHNSLQSKDGPREFILSYDEAYDSQELGVTNEAFNSVVPMYGVGVGVGGVLERRGAERMEYRRNTPATPYTYGDCSTSDEYGNYVNREDKGSKAAYRNACFTLDEEATADCRRLDNKDNYVPAPTWNEPSLSNTRIYYSYNEAEQYTGSSKPCGCVTTGNELENFSNDNDIEKKEIRDSEDPDTITLDDQNIEEDCCSSSVKDEEEVTEEILPSCSEEDMKDLPLQPDRHQDEPPHCNPLHSLEECSGEDKQLQKERSESEEPQCNVFDAQKDNVVPEHIVEILPYCPEVAACDDELPTYRSLIAFRLEDCPPNYETVTGIPVNVDEIHKDITGAARGRLQEEIRSCSDLNSSAKRLLALMATIIIAICVVMIILTI